MSIEQRTKLGNDYAEAKNKVESLQQTILFMDTKEEGYSVAMNIEFKGMYRRASKTIYLSEKETKDILNTRLSDAIRKRDMLFTKYANE